MLILMTGWPEKALPIPRSQVYKTAFVVETGGTDFWKKVAYIVCPAHMHRTMHGQFHTWPASPKVHIYLFLQTKEALTPTYNLRLWNFLLKYT